MTTRACLMQSFPTGILILAASVLCADDWDPPNLAQNPGFEEAGADGAPTHWSSYTVVSDVSHSGGRSLFYENSDPERYVLATQKLPLEPGTAYEVSVWIKTEGIEGADNGATLCLEWYDADGEYLGGHYPAGFKGTNDWQQLTSQGGRVPESATDCSVLCYMRKGMTGKAWWDDVEVRQWREPPLETMLLQPSYRGEIWPRTKRIEVLAELLLRDYPVGPAEVYLRSDIRRENGELVRTARRNPREAETLIELPARGLPRGSYALEVGLYRKDNDAELGSDSWRLRVVDPADLASRASYIDEHNRLIIGGEPFFPLGMYWSSISEEDITLYADSAFNCLMPYGAPSQEQMDLVHQRGLKVIYTVKDIYYGSSYAPEGIETAEDERAWIEGKANAFRDHPALLGWYLNDELPLSFMDRLERHQGWMEELDPGHPTWVVLYQVGLLEHYVRTFDAIGTDPYPIPGSTARRAGTWTQMTVDAVHGSRPVWMVPQVFNWACYRKTEEEKTGLRPPTLAEMRSMTWQCIARGANGLIYYSWFDIKRDTVVPFEEQWGHVKQVAGEVKEMIPVILSVEAAPEIHARERAWLHWTTRKLGDTVYLMAVNDQDRSHHVSFRLPEAPKSIRLRGEQDVIEPPSDGRLEVEFEPHGVRIYEIQF